MDIKAVYELMEKIREMLPEGTRVEFIVDADIGGLGLTFRCKSWNQRIIITKEWIGMLGFNPENCILMYIEKFKHDLENRNSRGGSRDFINHTGENGE